MTICGLAGHIPEQTGSRFGHCALCHRDFMGEGAWDKHRRSGGAGRYCVDPATDDDRTSAGRPIAEWRQDDRGRWHEGAKSEFWKKEEE